jgi:hypothetical protein
VSVHGPRRAGLFRVVLGLHDGLRLQPSTSPTSCSCRPRPDAIVLGLCSCRAKISCFGPAHGPRAKQSSISTALAHGEPPGAAAAAPPRSGVRWPLPANPTGAGNTFYSRGNNVSSKTPGKEGIPIIPLGWVYSEIFPREERVSLSSL